MTASIALSRRTILAALLVAAAPAAWPCTAPEDPWLVASVAAREGDRAELACWLRFVDKDGHDPADIWENTLLHIAAAAGQVNTVALLVQHGAGVNRRNATGATPLKAALKAGQPDTAAFLVFHGADIESPDEAGRTMLFWAVAGSDVAMVRLLLEHGANPDAALNIDGGPATLRDYAATRDHERIIELMTATTGDTR